MKTFPYSKSTTEAVAFDHRRDAWAAVRQCDRDIYKRRKEVTTTLSFTIVGLVIFVLTGNGLDGLISFMCTAHTAYAAWKLRGLILARPQLEWAAEYADGLHLSMSKEAE